MDDLIITGANNLAVLTARLKRLGENELRKQMLAGIRSATKPMIAAARTSAREHLPKAGGLNEIVAASKFSTRTRTAGRSPGVRVVGRSGIDIDAIDRGRVRHPVFGNRKVWVTETVPPGWFTGAMRAHAEEPRQAVIRVLDEIARQL